MKAKELLVEFYDFPGDLTIEYDNRRRPKLTLSMIRAMRMAREMKKVDTITHLEFLPTMYKMPANPSPM